MFHQIVAQCAQALTTVEMWLDEAERHAAEKRFDAGILAAGRLAPDMQPLTYQVTSACDYVKGAAALLTGQAPPKHEDTERTLDELRARIRKTVAYVESVEVSRYAGAGEREMKLSWAPGKVIAAEPYVLQVTIPNVYFHVVMIYAILRHNGVGLGKMDFLGPMAFVDA